VQILLDLAAQRKVDRELGRLRTPRTLIGQRMRGPGPGRARARIGAAGGVLTRRGPGAAREGTVGVGKVGLEDLAAAASALERSPAVLEHARALTDLGAALRRSNRRSEARAPLARARELAHRCRALVLTERAEAELRATGARPRRFALAGTEALTASEQRVANLGASGLSNREIAQQLFVTVNTVESHLRHAYLKLGVHSRGELPVALSGEPTEPV
jgi:DNA-binding CsgD family transcriptional regulator